jgi:hypothetical protein
MLMKPIALCIVAIAMVVATRATADEPVQRYLALGQAGATCVKYLQARDAEAKARPPDAPPGRVFTAQYIIFVGLADGVLTTANRLDNANPDVGVNSIAADRMDWLETYCHDHSLELFVNAVFSLREHLLQQKG